MVKIIKNLTTVNRTVGGNLKRYIVLHFTANKTDTAKENSNYFKSVYRGTSAHYFVDKDSIYQVVDDDDVAYAVGKNYGKNNLFGTVTNRNSISVEMCSDNGAIAEATFNNTADLIRYLMRKHGIPADRVVRHWDVCSKNCPGWNGWGAAGKDASIWNRFKNAIATNQGWQKNSAGWWYVNADGSYPANGWKHIDNEWYYFDEKGYAIHDTWKQINGHWFYFKSGCQMATGWRKVDGAWYYLNPDASSGHPLGSMMAGWIYQGRYWYYLNPVSDGTKGAMVHGWQTINGNKYYFLPESANGNPEGSMATGWCKVDGEWYYFNTTYNCQPVGAVLVNHWLTDGGKKYYLKEDGKMACGETLEIGGESFSFDESGFKK